VRIGPSDTIVRRRDDGVIYMDSPFPLAPYATKLTERLEYWAAYAPDRTLFAERDPSGAWRRVSYREALALVRSLAQGILDRGLSPARPIVILSGNSIDHALLALASMYAGVLYAPIAPAYSLQAREFTTLTQIFARMQPGLVFAAEGAAFERALSETLPPGCELLVSTSAPAGIAATRYADMAATPATAAVDEAHARVTGDTIAKILFTSGSTGRPKGVINTQRMLCSNQEMLRAVFLFLQDAPPVLCDWLPWNHTAGGNHNFGIVLYNGGTLYIDEGKPTPQGFGATVRNLREIPCTAHLTVPRFYELLMPHLRSDAVLRETFFRDLKVIFYAAAGLGQKFWDELRDVSVQACGEELLIMTGLGATETSPFAICTGLDGAFAGMIGLPVPGTKMKLAPVGGKLEGRVKGPHITPGYFKDEELTRAAFDEEGYYKYGDGMRFVDEADPKRGLIFDGRLAEDFKLSTGTWVSVGPLRAKIIAAGAGVVQDVVIGAPDRDYVTALLFPNVHVCREVSGLGPDATPLDVVRHPRVVARFTDALRRLAAESTGGSTFVARAMVMEESPSADAREITDKGSLNQKAVLAHRAALLDELYAHPPSPRVILARDVARA
jgi:feruloyl-CoA synthase